mmetsp:Transcript_12967/g.29895  ORF Transcript_12967/g.29895 Transcript_12967/m.29895 type:complete len:240 (+) Transcript_12967:10-729(+)
MPSEKYVQRFTRQLFGQPRRWWEIDAAGMVCGNLATRITTVLMGKHKPIYDPKELLSDHVVVRNCSKVMLTGRKPQQKVYHHYTGYPGGLRTTTVAELLEKKPEEVIRRAVFGMLPANLLRKDRMRFLICTDVGDELTLPPYAELHPLPQFFGLGKELVPQWQRYVDENDQETKLYRLTGEPPKPFHGPREKWIKPGGKKKHQRGLPPRQLPPAPERLMNEGERVPRVRPRVIQKDAMV